MTFAPDRTEHHDATERSLMEAPMVPSPDDESSEPDSRSLEQSITIYCRLFNDFVSMRTCSRRKKDLNIFGWQSCNGCAIGLTQYWSKCLGDKDNRLLKEQRKTSR
jgi:hypothetical protein